MVTLIFSLLGWGVIPLGPGLALSDFSLGILYSLALSSIGVYGILFAVTDFPDVLYCSTSCSSISFPFALSDRYFFMLSIFFFTSSISFSNSSSSILSSLILIDVV